MSNQLTVLSNQLANHFNLGDGTALIDTLKKTAFKGGATDEQMAALLIVANQYKLNPWTRVIYAFPDSRNGIVPIVGVDGWSRIINSYTEFDGMEFKQDDESCTCIIYRKDRAHPISVTEWMSECKRDSAQPWKTHPKRMLRHKAMIQCARLAFGFVGIYDQDEAERIRESDRIPENVDIITGEIENPERQNIIARAEIEAEKGIDSFTEFYKTGVTKEQRAIVGNNEWKRLGEKAKLISSNTVDHEDGANGTTENG